MKRLVVLTVLGGLFFGGDARADVMPRNTGKKVVAVLPFSAPHRWSAMGRNAQAT
ncbi:MAG: hypothetical protein JRH20_01595, partial [Deltaproteobacteria bacterium]|nr:hypothetical protein [Deltaproteobacteria bacterium]